MCSKILALSPVSRDVPREVSYSGSEEEDPPAAPKGPALSRNSTASTDSIVGEEKRKFGGGSSGGIKQSGSTGSLGAGAKKGQSTLQGFFKKK